MDSDVTTHSHREAPKRRRLLPKCFPQQNMIPRPQAVLNAITLVISAPTTLAGAGDWCSGLRGLGNIHSDPENPYLQSLTLYARLHYQADHIDGDDNLGDSFHNSADNYRRARVGAKVDFLRHFSAKAVVDAVLDNRYRGGDLDWGYRRFDSATITFDLADAFRIGAIDTLSLTYGRHVFTLTSEMAISSNNIISIERSAITNKLHNDARPTGFSLQAGKNGWLVTAAVFSTEDDSEFLGGFNDGLAYFAAIERSVSENINLRLDAVVNDTSPGDDDILGYDWAASLNMIWDEKPYGILAAIILGDNGAQPGGRGGAFHGVTVMPWFWIVPEKLQAVFQYSHSSSDEPAGIRANLRYLTGSQNIASVNSGSGDRLHTFYLGLNHHLCGDNLKLMGGIEYASLGTPGGNVSSLTYTLAARVFF